MRVTRKEFVRVWQRSKDLKEVSETLNMGVKTVGVKASILRNRHGIPLKKFKRGPKYKTKVTSRRK